MAAKIFASSTVEEIGDTAIKVCMLGESGTGKTSIVTRLTKDKFNNNEKATIGSSFVIYNVKCEPSPNKFVHIRYEIWDTAGQERYRSLAPMYYRGARVAIIVYNETDGMDSLEQVEKWIKEVKVNTEGSEYGVPEFVILCNKIDIVKCNKKALSEFGSKYNVLYFDCSALTGEGVKDIFHGLAVRYSIQDFEQNIRQHDPEVKKLTATARDGVVKLDTPGEPQQPISKGICC